MKKFVEKLNEVDRLWGGWGSQRRRIILKQIFKGTVWMWTGFIWLGGPTDGLDVLEKRRDERRGA